VIATAHPPTVETLATIDSTNAEAKRRAQAGMRGPIWIRAETQSAGVGRNRRAWHSPLGNLYATLLTPFNGALADAALMSFVACLAVADTLNTSVASEKVSLKWPNDALLDGKKVAGVLLEAGGVENARWLAIGVGINLAHKPDDARWPPIALSDVTLPPSPEIALETLIQSFDKWLSTFERDGFSPIRKAWLSRAARLGQRIEARLPDITHVGVFEGLSNNGALILGTDSGEMRIAAADIYFPT